MYKFEKILSDNNIAENSTDLPKAITVQITKFRSIEKKIENAPDNIEANEKLTNDLLDLDKKIYTLIEENFDVEDEEEENNKKAEQKRIADAEKENAAIAEKNKKKLEKEAADADAEKEAEKKKATDKAKKEAEEAEEDKKPATSNEGALAKLFKQGKKTVTVNELKAAGFDTGWNSPIGMNGCNIGAYKLYRDSQFDNEFTLSQR
jgi:membrane protein involved in colicin uptake